MRLKSNAKMLITALCAVSTFFIIPPGYSADNDAISSEQSINAPCCGPITAAGQKILSVLDNSNVETLWLNHQHVDWQTGEPDKAADYSGPGDHSHCSAFAAAMAERLGVYMLRPPEHSQILLASAQTQWFDTQTGRDAGWVNVRDAVHAQQLANEGKLVVISYESPDPKKPGHIVIIRPSLISLSTLQIDGPEITQAGTINELKGYAAQAFASHPGAWPDGVKYFAHNISN